MSGDYVNRSSRFNERGRRHRDDEESRYSEEYDDDDVSSTTSSEAEEDKKRKKKKIVTFCMILCILAGLICGIVGAVQWNKDDTSSADDGGASE